MKPFWRTFRAEIAKQHRELSGGKMVFFSLLFWPVLTFFTSYFAMKPYRDGSGSALAQVIGEGSIPLFLVSGFMVFQLFWTVVQSAWTFEWERRQGTLEIIYLTPASKIAFLFGRSVYSLFNGIWMFFVFSALTFLLVADLGQVNWGYLVLSLAFMTISAVIWGAFLCSICLFSRDSGFLYYIFHSPMDLFGGVRIPPAVFPIWAKLLSIFFPVTYCLFMLREALNGHVTQMWWWMALVLTVLNILILLTTFRTLQRAEQHSRKHGNWVMF
ncbi:ABC transporter permease [Brevibacillus sp. SYSU BS000544]|uniref:ABC transporter permease n=1 Tax=Brevibacillus sp. SYSU BS000544 TaxID=3416443 RepID=UPI003CE4C174